MLAVSYKESSKSAFSFERRTKRMYAERGFQENNLMTYLLQSLLSTKSPRKNILRYSSSETLVALVVVNIFSMFKERCAEER